MHRKFLLFILFIISFQIINAQNEFVTVWKPNLPHPNPSLPYAGIPVNSSNTQIWIPAVGTDFQIQWEEIGYPTHHGILPNVTSTYQVFIDFGAPLNPISADATYRVKISNGSGNFHRIRFANWDIFPNGDGIVGDAHKIINIEKWGNTHWSSMEQGFQACRNMDITATDIPDFSNVTNMSNMFAGNSSLVGNPTFANWDISNVTNLLATFSGCSLFNQPIGSWNTSNVTMMGVTFGSAIKFNQPLANWNTSKVNHMTAMFNNAKEFDQPIGNWDLSSVIDCEFMFSYAVKFNQPIGNWNTSAVIEMDRMFNQAKAFNQDISNWNTGNVNIMEGMFAGAQNFNQNIGNWNVSQVATMSNMFNGASNFNQNLGAWNLNSLTSAAGMLLNSGLNCQNYDNAIYGWNIRSTTPNNINLGSVSPLVYSNPSAVNARNNLLSNKGWTITGDTYNGECQSVLSTSEILIKNEVNIYPNPATDFMYVKNLKGSNSYKIFDISGRIVLQNNLNDKQINISSLTKGDYILQIISKDKIQSLKFIKK